MKQISAAIKVGVTFIIVSALGYSAFMLLVKGSLSGDADKIVLSAYFHDATGLVEKSRVQISGLIVGHIASRELNISPPRADLVKAKRFAKINITIDGGVKLYRNATIYKRSASLLGEFYLEIDPGTETEGKNMSGNS